MTKAKATDAKATDVTATAVPKKSKHRSPNHPLVGLEKAIELATTVEAKFGSHEVPLNLIHDLWKYKPWGSVGDQCVAALKSYGLIKVTGMGKARKLSLTEAGMRIAKNAPNKDALIRNAAMAPALHRQIAEHFGAKGLPNDALLRQYLVWDRPEGQRFNEDSVDSFIERFRKALDYSGATASDIVGASTDGDEDESEADESSDSSDSSSEWNTGTSHSTSSSSTSTASSASQKVRKKTDFGITMRELPITLPSLAVAVLRVPVPMSEDDFQTLTLMLAAFKPSLLKKPCADSEAKTSSQE